MGMPSPSHSFSKLRYVNVTHRASTMKEVELYPALLAFLTDQGFEVRSEVHHCDLTASKGDELVIIELKLNLNLALLVQAAKRQRLTDHVYVAVPKPSAKTDAERWRGVHLLLRRLELGLLYVDMSQETARVEIVFHPLPYHKRRTPMKRAALLREIAARSGNFNVAGSVRRQLMTAYRESALLIAYRLEQLGEASPRTLRKSGTCPGTQSILAHNYYKWFDRVGRGTYRLTEIGISAVSENSAVLQEILRKQSS